MECSPDDSVSKRATPETLSSSAKNDRHFKKYTATSTSRKWRVTGKKPEIEVLLTQALLARLIWTPSRFLIIPWTCSVL